MIFWIGFNLFVLAMLALDLFVFHRKSHVIKLKEALVWSGIWIGLALIFNAALWFWKGPQPALEFLTGYLLEKSLSVDNIFVFIMIFAAFKLPQKYEHDVLFWGILGALITRAAFIAGGITLMEHFHGIIYVFGAFLIFSGIKMCVYKDKEVDLENNKLLQVVKRFVPITHRYHGNRFFGLD